MTPGLSGYKTRCKAYGLPVVIEHFTREQLIDRYGNECYRCGGPFEQLDHVLCVRAGGPHTLANTRPICARCNQQKYQAVDRLVIARMRTDVANRRAA
ncbi:HNH endonuclease [Williamsia muralis]|uniref:HNH endonuclease n=1 Tax=Williamsia marianensis TaxID=85044 RepID=UPI000A017EC7